VSPSLSFGYGYLGRSGVALNLSLDAGIPLDRLGKWRLLLGAQGRILPQMTPDDELIYLVGLKGGFLRGPAVGSPGWQYGAFGEINKGWFQSGTAKEEGVYLGGGLSLRYSVGLDERVFIGIDVAGGARIDTTKPEKQKLFFAGLTFGREF
jgi:hypothetical protein